MTLETRVRDLALRIGTEFNTAETERGSLASLSTTDKTSLVNSINEVATSAGNAAVINDASASGTETYSSNKITADITAATSAVQTAILGGASAAYDTLLELQNEIQGNDTDLATLLTSVNNRVRFDVATQGLTATEQGNARTNILAQSSAEIGNADRDFVADFEGALA